MLCDDTTEHPYFFDASSNGHGVQASRIYLAKPCFLCVRVCARVRVRERKKERERERERAKSFAMFLCSLALVLSLEQNLHGLYSLIPVRAIINYLRCRRTARIIASGNYVLSKFLGRN